MKEFGNKIKGVEYVKRPGSYGILLDDGRIGVVRSSAYESYFLVGGGIDANETEIESLHREAKEEIGFEIEIGEKLGSALEYFFSQSEKQHTAKECHFYRVRLIGESDGNGKHELVWISPDKLDEMHHESYRWIVENELEKEKDNPNELPFSI